MHVWSSGAGEPEGLNRAGGISVHTSPLAGLLHVLVALCEQQGTTSGPVGQGSLRAKAGRVVCSV